MKKEDILILDDQPEILNALERQFKDRYQVYVCNKGEDALEVLRKKIVAVIISDQRMPGMTGVEFFNQARKLQPDSIRILITAYADLNATINAVNEGKISHYIAKPWEPDELDIIVQQAVDKYRLIQENHAFADKLQKANEKLQEENVRLKQSIGEKFDFSHIIGHSPKMLSVFKLASKVVDTPTTVLILGETGTGKELLARAIHYNGKRKERIFVAQNCGAMPDSLLESELFGHEKGAFTGAIKTKLGLFELADGGTIFLDEIGDTSPAMQQRLLRVLQEGEIRRVGATKPIHVNIRIIAATNKNLEKAVKNKEFREDLYYRLNVFPIQLPPLRERKEDFQDLISHFIYQASEKIEKRISGISDEALALLQKAEFPGNVRELENEIERAVTLSEVNGKITPDLLSPRFHQNHEASYKTLSLDMPLKGQIEALEKKLIHLALNETQGNILKAAEKLGLSRAGLHKKLNRYQIHMK